MQFDRSDDAILSYGQQMEDGESQEPEDVVFSFVTPLAPFHPAARIRFAWVPVPDCSCAERLVVDGDFEQVLMLC